jgi:hypothetical protein
MDKKIVNTNSNYFKLSLIRVYITFLQNYLKNKNMFTDLIAFLQATVSKKEEISAINKLNIDRELSCTLYKTHDCSGSLRNEINNCS